MQGIAERTIVITGGAKGLGAEYARALHSAGAKIGIADIDDLAGVALANELGERCSFVHTDVTNPESVRKAFASFFGLFGGLHVLVNNAGIYPHKNFEDIELEDWKRVMTLNLDSVFICTKEAVRIMKPAHSGKIINIATNLLWIMAPRMGHYIAAKAGVLGFSRGIARELAEYGITCNILAPGAIMPEGELDEDGVMHLRQIVSYQAIKRPTFAFDLVGAMLFLCSEASDFMTGQAICVDGGVAVH